MKKKPVFWIMPVCLALVTIMAAASCQSFQVSGIEVAQQTTTSDVAGMFDINVKVNKFLGQPAGVNLFNVTSDATDPKILDAVKTEIAKYGGSRAVNVKIEYTSTFVDILLTVITGMIYAPATAHVTGTVLR